jgi:hypothetical protein
MNAPITYYQYKDLKDFCYINLNKIIKYNVLL